LPYHIFCWFLTSSFATITKHHHRNVRIKGGNAFFLFS
jgi:hypothetical protein